MLLAHVLTITYPKCDGFMKPVTLAMNIASNSDQVSINRIIIQIVKGIEKKVVIILWSNLGFSGLLSRLVK